MPSNDVTPVPGTQTAQPAPAINLTLPTNAKLAMSWKQIGFVALVVLSTLAMLYLTITGQWKLVSTLMLKLKLKQQELQLANLDTLVEHNIDTINNDQATREKFVNDRKKMESARLQSQLEVNGKSHAEIVAELQAKGF
jgi:hypothetical protein